MNEHFVVQVWLHFGGLLDQVAELNACAFVLLVLGINNIDESSALGDLPLQVALEHVVSWEVDHVEVDVVVRVDLLGLNLR